MYYSIKEVAKILKINDTTILSWIRTYKLYYIRYSITANQKHFAFSKKDIETVRRIKDNYYKARRGRKPNQDKQDTPAQRAQYLPSQFLYRKSKVT